MKSDPLRILPIGTPQDTLLNYMLNCPDRLAGKDVLEPFAGSGVLGLMALKLGARCVDFLDINPRAVEFQRASAADNGFSPESYRTIEGSIEDFTAERPYDLIFANPPFLPTPEGVAGSLTSNGGIDGNRLLVALLKRVNALLKPSGELFAYVLQIERKGLPLIAPVIRELIPDRKAELTRTLPFGFGEFRDAYFRLFPDSSDEITAWSRHFADDLEDELQLRHYVIHILPKNQSEVTLQIADDLEQKYGVGLDYPGETAKQLAANRAQENVIPEFQQ